MFFNFIFIFIFFLKMAMLLIMYLTAYSAARRTSEYSTKGNGKIWNWYTLLDSF